MHEQSETVEREGRWYNVYGVGPKKGRPLPKRFEWEQPSYASQEEAVRAAKRRSEQTDRPSDEQGVLPGDDDDTVHGQREPAPAPPAGPPVRSVPWGPSNFQMPEEWRHRMAGRRGSLATQLAQGQTTDQPSPSPMTPPAGSGGDVPTPLPPGIARVPPELAKRILRHLPDEVLL